MFPASLYEVNCEDLMEVAWRDINRSHVILRKSDCRSSGKWPFFYGWLGLLIPLPRIDALRGRWCMDGS